MLAQRKPSAETLVVLGCSLVCSATFAILFWFRMHYKAEWESWPGYPLATMLRSLIVKPAFMAMMGLAFLTLLYAYIRPSGRPSAKVEKLGVLVMMVCMVFGYVAFILLYGS